jgi:chromatin remodeling complex protein RSC6
MSDVKQKKAKRSSKMTRRKKKQPKIDVVPDVSEVVAEPPAPRKKSKKQKKVEFVEEPPKEEVETSEEVVPLSKSSKRLVMDKEMLGKQFDDFLSVLESELEQSREDKNRNVNVKTWRSLIKDAKKLKNTSLKAMKKPKKRTSNTKSGFMKPVAITSEMAKFAGWDENELKSRVDVTTYLCDYIKKNDLQNPEDRRQILADEKLCSLLKYDKKKDKQPLTYYHLQTKIQPLFKKE